MKVFENKRVLITGGTGSLGKVLTKRILSGVNGKPSKVVVFSRDEAKQHSMRIRFLDNARNIDDTIYDNFRRILQFKIGDVRNFHSIANALKDIDIVINAAALKQVPSCEYFPHEAMLTNIDGANNIVRAIDELNLPIETVVGVSTDKACKPVNVMGMTKAVMERVFISANIHLPNTRFICVRYGNVLASRGSVIPLFHEQILNRRPLTITTEKMTRFLIPLEKAVDTIIFGLNSAERGETIIPKVPSAYIIDVAKVLSGKKDYPITITGIRPGEKYDEILISDEEAWHSYPKGDYYAISPMLPELSNHDMKQYLHKEYSSADSIMNVKEVYDLLKNNNLLIENIQYNDEELLR